MDGWMEGWMEGRRNEAMRRWLYGRRGATPVTTAQFSSSQNRGGVAWGGVVAWWRGLGRGGGMAWIDGGRNVI